jgi:hypothetical protein
MFIKTFLEIGAFLLRDKWRGQINVRALTGNCGETIMTGFRPLFAMIASFATITLATSVVAFPAHAQDVTEAQKSAIRSNCRSDFMSKCSSVTPGGTEAFQCLKKNEATLSGGCRAAVDAIKLPSAAPAAAPVPAAAPAAPAPAASAPKPAEPATAAAPAAAKPAAPAPAKPAAAPKPAVASAPPAAAPAPAPAPAVSSQPKPPTIQEAVLVRRFCTVDYQTLCKGVRVGGGRVIKCLSDNQPALSPGCKEAVARAQ